MCRLWGNQSSLKDCRAHGEVISLVVTNPRITEWLYAGNLSPDSSQIPSAELTVCKSVTCEMLPLDKGHFITADKHISLFRFPALHLSLPEIHEKFSICRTSFRRIPDFSSIYVDFCHILPKCADILCIKGRKIHSYFR